MKKFWPRRLLKKSRQPEPPSIFALKPFLNSTFEINGDGLIAVDTEGRVIFMNRIAETLTGWMEADALNRPVQAVFMLLDRESNPPVEDFLLKSITTGEPCSLIDHYCLISREGGKRPVQFGINPRKNTKGKVTEALLFFRDVSKNQETLQELKLSEARFRQITALCEEWIWEQDASGRFTYSSAAVVNILGYAPEEMLGRHYWEFAWEEESGNGIQLVAKNASLDPFFRYENRYRHKQGYEVITESSGEPVLDEAGEVVKWHGIDRDISDEKSAEELIRRALQVAPIAMLMIDAEGVVRVVNSQFEILFGFGEDEIIGRKVEVLMPSRFHDQHVSYRNDYASSPRSRLMGAGGELTARRKNGDEFPIEAGLAPIKTKGGILVLSTIIDLSKRKEAEDVLAKAYRNKSKFLAILGHELRNPLMALNNAAELMRLSPTPEKNAWALEVIHHQVRDLNHLVNDLLDVARIAKGDIALEIKDIDVETLIRRSTETIQWFIDKNRQTLVVALPEKPLFVKGDLIWLSQVVVNLLHNASKYTPEGKNIYLETATTPDEIFIKIRDEGIGLTRQDLSNIFDLFSQGPRSKHEEGINGLGIGLTLSRRLTELHGGKLTASSKGPGLGSEFIICLPLDIAHQHPETAKPIPPTAPSAHYRILVIDDHPSSAESTAELLKVKGHDVRYAVTGREGIELAREFKPEIALIDIVLPDISGYECAARLRENPDTRHAKLIAITGMPPSLENQSPDQSLFDSYFIKPVTIKDIELWIVARMISE